MLESSQPLLAAVSTWAFSTRSTYCAKVRPSAAARFSSAALSDGKVRTEIAASRRSSAIDCTHCMLTCDEHGRNLHTTSYAVKEALS